MRRFPSGVLVELGAERALRRVGVRGEPTWQLHMRGFNRVFALLLDLHAGEALGVVP